MGDDINWNNLDKQKFFVYGAGLFSVSHSLHASLKTGHGDPCYQLVLLSSFLKEVDLYSYLRKCPHNHDHLIEDWQQSAACRNV